ncbi:hypothetical protein, partial [Escherichia coli]
DMTGWQNDSKALKSFLDNIVTPEMFGNNIIAAADFAISSGGVLFTSNRVYEVSQEFKVPANTVWISNNSTVKQVGAALTVTSASVIAPQSNVRIIGHLTLDMTG